jgi:hypothetical protein
MITCLHLGPIHRALHPQGWYVYATYVMHGKKFCYLSPPAARKIAA